MNELEQALRYRAMALAQAEHELAQEYLLHVGSGQPTWAAQKMAEVRHNADVRRATAEYEIALARLRRA